MARRRVGQTLAAAAVVFTASCTGSVMPSPPTPDGLLTPGAPVLIDGRHAVARTHGHVISGAGEGALEGMGAGAEGTLQSGEPLAILLLPAAVVIGGVMGAAMAHPTKEVEAALAAIEAVYGDAMLLGIVDERLAERLEAKGWSVDVARHVWPPEDQAPPEDAEDAEASGTFIELTTTYHFWTQGEYSPELVLVCNVTASVRRSEADLEEVRQRWGYRSAELKFFEATADAASGLRDEIVRAEEALARRIAEDLHDGGRGDRLEGRFVWHPRGKVFVPTLKEGAVVKLPPDPVVLHHRAEPAWEKAPGTEETPEE